MINAYPQEIVSVLLWALLTLGGMLGAAFVWFGSMLWARLSHIESYLRGDLASLDRRLSRIEGKIGNEGVD